MLNFSQEQIFILFFIVGIIIGIIFDFFRAIRKSFQVSDGITFFQDIVFLFISGSLIIYSIIKLNSGEVRFYLFLGIFFGICIYSLTISNFCVIILYVFVELCKNVLKIPYICLKESYYWLSKLIKKWRDT